MTMLTWSGFSNDAADRSNVASSKSWDFSLPDPTETFGEERLDGLDASAVVGKRPASNLEREVRGKLDLRSGPVSRSR
jgi:hypothetical protein